MVWFDVDVFRRCVVVDLHDYSHRTAILAARQKIREAYEHGFRYVRLIHGGANLRQKGDGASIKFALRSMARSGELDRWIEGKDSKNHRIKDGSIVLALRMNPQPVDKEWKEMPGCEY